MSLQRSGTRKGGPGTAAKSRKGYDIVQQGIKELYPLDQNAGSTPDIDIVLVPGLGANPEDSWKSEKTGFNWTTSPDGIIRDFPKARILLYMYESAWVGSLKVKQFMSNIAMSLLVALRSKRENCKSRPIVFIGHSMGGLVIAKAVTYADSRRDLFPVMFEAIAATIFFGTPFKGAEVAAWAAMYAHFAEKVNVAANSKLLDFMKPGAESLRELRQEFLRLVGKLDHKIQVVCFWEQEPTDFSKMAHLPGLFGLAKAAIPKNMADFVTYDSATLDGVPDAGLSCNHRDLVKFDGPKDERWSQTVREHVKRLVNGAHLAAKNRVASARDLDWSSLKGIMEALGNPQTDKKRKEVAKAVSLSSWITGVEDYTRWAQTTTAREGPDEPGILCTDFLWIRGREGRGKTGAAIASLKQIETLVKEIEEQNSGQDAALLAYFFCDPAVDYCTGEDLLKSLLCQLIGQQTALAAHAMSFVKKKGKDGVAKSQALPTIENLWQCLQNMLSDEFAGGCVYIVINNLHVLPEDSDSTVKLMSYLSSELQGIKPIVTDSQPWRVPTRWLITSRNSHNVSQVLSAPGVRLVDLEDEKYGNKVQLDLRRHAKAKVAALGAEKKYNQALAYFASSLIGKRAQNIHWIDITCIQLEELPEAESHVRIRRFLENTPEDLTALLNDAWQQIFGAHDDNGEKIKEMLRALLLTFEDPTETELGVLAGLSSTEADKEELRSLMDKCKPLLVAKRTVGFMNPAVKAHLQEHAQQLLGLSADEIKWQHGILALRSLEHLKGQFGFPEAVQEPAPGLDQGGGEDASDGGGEEDVDDDGEDSDDDDDDDGLDYSEGDDDSESPAYGYDEAWNEEEDEDQDPEADQLRDLAEAYAVKHWLHHGSKATAEFADDLSREIEFWAPGSRMRRRWLVEYTRLTNHYDRFDRKSLTALHVASSIGFRQLVAGLLENGYEDEIRTYDSLQNSPLHLAAFFGRPGIVEELLNRGAAINDGGAATDSNEDTPLHMAAEAGHVDVMKKLMHWKADENAYSDSSGLVINAAISSGKFGAVELLVQKGVSLTPDRGDVESPLAQAAAMADISMLEYLMQQYKHQLPAEEYSKALVSAAGAGRVEIFNRLLQFQHGLEDYQWALNRAAEEAKWDIVTILLEQRSDLDCDEAFYQAATGAENKDQVLEALWEYTGGNISHDRVDDSLYDATDSEKLSTVELLLEKFGADANATGSEYGNALTAASYDGRLDILRLLLNAGADVNSPNGWALQTAAEEGHKEIVEELLGRGANVNAFTQNENFPAGTALQGATETGKADLVALLLQHGADPNLGGGDDAPPILAAAGYAEEEILASLIDAKADVNVVGADEDRSTPLIAAAEFIAGTDSLRKLLDAGAHINQRNGHGETALIVAAREGDDEVVRFLLQNGADVMHTADDGTNALKAALDSNETECLRALVDHVSSILSALKSAMESGNAAVTAVVRGATSPTRVDDRDDPARGNRVMIAPIVAQSAIPPFSTEPHMNGAPPVQPAAEVNGAWGQYTSPYDQTQASQQQQPPPPTKTQVSVAYSVAQQSSLTRADSPAQLPLRPTYHEYDGNGSPATQDTPGSSRQSTPARRNPATGPEQYQAWSSPSNAAVDQQPQAYGPPPPRDSYQPYAPGLGAGPTRDDAGRPTEAPWPQASYLPQGGSGGGGGAYAQTAPAYADQSPSQSQSQSRQQPQGNTNQYKVSATFSSYQQDISSYDGSQWGDSGDSPGRDTASSYSSYPRHGATTLSAQQPPRPPAQHSYSAPPPAPNPGWQEQQQQQQAYANSGGNAQPSVGWNQPVRPDERQDQAGFFGRKPLDQARSMFGGAYR